MKTSFKNRMIGGMDSDSSPFFIKEGDYIDAQNIVFGESGAFGGVSNVKGTVNIGSLERIGLDNKSKVKVIGITEDKQGQRAFVFAVHTNPVSGVFDEGLILMWDAKDSAADILLPIVKGTSLGFNDLLKIHSAGVINSQYLTWVDGYLDILGNRTGGEPSMLDISRANDYQKFRKYEVYGGVAGQGQFNAQYTYTFNLVDLSGTNLGSFTFTPQPHHYSNPAAALSAMGTALQDSTIGGNMTVTECDGCKLMIEMADVEMKLEFFSTKVGEPDCLLVSVNHFPDDIYTRDIYFRIGRRTAACAPVATYVRNDSQLINNVGNLRAAFRVRYIYRDSTKSCWSAVSNVALNTGTTGEKQEWMNAIEVDFSDEKLNDAGWLSLIDSIEISARFGPDEPFRLVATKPVCEIGLSGSQKFVFDNLASYPVVASDDPTAVTDPSVQVIRNFDNLPLQVMSQEIVADDEGNARIFYGGVTEGYESPDCVNIDTEVVRGNDECLITVKGTIEVEGTNLVNVLPSRYVYLAGTPYFAIANPTDGGLYSFEIKGVPRGIYSLRVGTPFANYGNATPPEYNFASFEVQRTSAPIFDWGPSGQVGERTVDLRAFTGHTYNVDVGLGGNIVIQGIDVSQVLIEVYVLDNSGDISTKEARYAANSVEQQEVKFYLAAAGSPSPTPFKVMTTDHAGYAWMLLDTADSPAATEVKVVVSSMTGNKIYRADAGWLSLKQGTEVELTGGLIPVAGVPYKTLFAINNAPSWSNDNIQQIVGNVTNSGVGIEGASVWIDNTNRTPVTNADGEWTTFLYRKHGEIGTERDYNVYANILRDFCYKFPFDNPSYSGTITNFGQSPLFTGNFQTAMRNSFGDNLRSLKSGGAYRVGLLYEDDLGRTSGVVHAKDISIPWQTELLGYGSRRLKLSINHLPPEWAKKYRVVITRNRIHNSYFQFVAAEVRYGTIADGSTAFTTGSFATGTHVLLKVNIVVNQDVSTNPLLLMFNPNSTQGYKVSDGDEIRLMLKPTVGTQYGYDSPKFGQLPGGKVVGEFFDGGEYFIVAQNSSFLSQVAAGDVFEVFTPLANSLSSELYYETGDCYMIVDNKHLANVQYQTNSVPAVVIVEYGDTWWRVDEFKEDGGAVRKPRLEHDTKSRDENEVCVDGGRAFSEDKFAQKQIFYGNRIRYSGVFAPVSSVNNLTVFGSIDFKNINIAFGPICKLAALNNVLLAICWNKIQSIYVGKGDILSMDGTSSLATSNQIMNIANESMSDFGCSNPESVGIEDGFCYGFDIRRGGVWRYGQNGIQDISAGLSDFFKRVAKEAIIKVSSGDVGSQTIFVGGIDRQYGQYLLNIDNTNANSYINPPDGQGAYTFGFDYRRGRWISRYTFSPDAMCSIGTNFISGYATKIGLVDEVIVHRHHAGSPFCNFYGEQRVAFVEFVVNVLPDAAKDWWNIRVNATNMVQALSIKIPATVGLPNGMLSSLRSSDFVKIEGALRADFLRDKNDPTTKFDTKYPIFAERVVAKLRNGRRLKGNILIIRLAPSSSASPINIYSVDTEFTASMQTK
jgi:hypothetical protein